MTDPNTFRYREFGYVEASDFAVRYVSATGYIKIRAEVYELRDNDNKNRSTEACEQRYRMKVECGDFWVTVHHVVTANNSGDGVRDRQIELTTGLTDGTVIAVTRSAGGDFEVTPRTAKGPADNLNEQRYMWPDGRPIFEFFNDVVTVIAADGTWTSADFGRADDFVCATYVSDGARVRMTMTRPAVHFCHDSKSGEPVTDKYLVCRRDLSGYEFVDDDDSRQTVCRVEENSYQETPVTIVRTLSQNRFDRRMAKLMDKALSDHLITVKTLADRLNAGLPDNDNHGDNEINELMDSKEFNI